MKPVRGRARQKRCQESYDFSEKVPDTFSDVGRRRSARVLLAAAVIAVCLTLPVPGPAAAASPAVPAARPRPAGAAPAAVAQATGAARTRAEVEALIQKAGATPPDWWNSVALNYPPTVDLKWPDMRGKPWNSQTNIGQYMWSVINENPSKWRGGVKLLHHCLMVNKGNSAALDKAMDALGNAYFNLLQDWPRAVFWWRKVGYDDDGYSARCYWKMGCKEMAVEVLNSLPPAEPGYGNIAKLWADMGETDKALAAADALVRAGKPEQGYLAAGDGRPGDPAATPMPSSITVNSSRWRRIRTSSSGPRTASMPSAWSIVWTSRRSAMGRTPPRSWLTPGRWKCRSRSAEAASSRSGSPGTRRSSSMRP